MIDYNLRRRGKRWLATLFFLGQWRFHQRPRAIIERHFAWVKRYFGLESARRGRGLPAHGFGLQCDAGSGLGGAPLPTS